MDLELKQNSTINPQRGRIDREESPKSYLQFAAMKNLPHSTCLDFRPRLACQTVKCNLSIFSIISTIFQRRPCLEFFPVVRQTGNKYKQAWQMASQQSAKQQCRVMLIASVVFCLGLKYSFGVGRRREYPWHEWCAGADKRRNATGSWAKITDLLPANHNGVTGKKILRAMPISIPCTLQCYTKQIFSFSTCLAKQIEGAK